MSLSFFFQTLSRQVREYRESLKFANKSCEHLELRLEESETEVKELKLKNVKREATIQLKIRIIDDLQSLLEKFESDNLQLQEDLKYSQNCSTKTETSATSPSQLERSLSYDERGQPGRSNTKELQEVIDDLNSKLSDVQYQKNRIKQNSEAITSENKKLREMLSKAESDVIELQAHVKFMEEVSNEKSEPATPIPPQSPGRRSFLSSSSNPGNMCPHCNGSLFDASSYMYDDTCSFSLSIKAGDGGCDTIFTELQNELNTLQTRFDKVLQDCTCSASIPYKGIMLDTPPPCGEVSNKQNDKIVKEISFETNDKFHKTSLKDLFEEVYASLKQSSSVADQLLVKRKVT